MATWDDVERVALGMPEATERESRGLRQWEVKGKLFVWERPLRQSDYKALGDAAPEEPDHWVPGSSTPARRRPCSRTTRASSSTTPHFDGYAVILVRLGLDRRRRP